MEIQIDQLDQLPQAASTLLHWIGNGRVVLFYGDMGAGKTTLIRELCKQLQVSDEPSSPTFSIVQEYDSPSGPIYHFDFYRLHDEQEALDLGYEDYFFSGHYCLVEWPEKIPSLLPGDAVQIHIDVLPSQSRLVSLKKSAV